jgi:PAS domain S-box-containing protein
MGSAFMGGTKQIPDQAGFRPDSTGLLNPDQTLRMLALSTTHADLSLEELGVEALHHATFLQLPLGVGYATREGTFIWCNEAFDRMLGLKPGEHKNKSIRELTHASDRDSNAELLDELWEGRRQSYTQDKRYMRRDGTELWVRVTAAMVRTPEGEPVCTVGFLEDVSARKQMEFEIERAQKALMDASRQAGMAEVATNVLKILGIVLKSFIV